MKLGAVFILLLLQYNWDRNTVPFFNKLNFIIRQKSITREGASAPSCFWTAVGSGWGYTNACVDNKEKASDPAKDKHKQCGLRAMVYYEPDSKDTTEDIEYFYVPFEPQVREQWQFASVAVVPKQPKRPVTKIRILCALEKNANNCWYDNISLVREASQTMAYDDDGNLQSVTTSGLSVDKSTYKNGNLIKTVTGGYGTFEYTYDTTHKHRLTSVTNGKIQQAMTYDSFGNVTGTTLSQEEGTGKTLQTSAAYDTSGNRLASVTDATGATVTYAYGNADSMMNGLPTTVTDPNNVDTTNVYDKNGRVTVTGIDNLAALYYTYNKGNLTTATRYEQGNYYQYYHFTYNDFGNMLSAKVGNKTLATYTYGPKNGPLLQQTYGNGDVLTFTYDDLGRMETATYDDGTVLTYHYNGEGTLHSVTEGDSQGNISRTYLYQYDTLGRLLSCQRLDGNQSVIRTWQHFNEHNQVDTVAWQTGSGSYSETYEYDEEDGSLTTVTGSDGNVQSLTYDILSRLSQHKLLKDEAEFLTESYTYLDIDTAKTTTQVQQKSIQGGSASFTFAYTYDGSGNILTETATKGTVVAATTYAYDSQNQLIRENNQAAGKTWVWTYDTVGNILSRKEHAYTTGTLGAVLDTVNYGYANTQWQDLLTNYDGSPITYDAIGNPLSDGRRTYTWENGRQLKSLNQNGTQVTYTYDGSGLRTGKTVGTGSATQSYSYIYNGDKLVEMTANGGTLRFTYDTNGNPATVVYNNATYYYVTNLQGDVIAILDGSRNSVAEYTYNAWGQVMSVTGSMATTLGQQNPLRYRGYVYDTETGLYYVSSRYYDPEIGRFINADDVDLLGANGDFASLNLFAYCGNNPVARVDSNGHFWEAIGIGFAAGIVGQYISDVIGNIQSGQTGVDIFAPTSSASDYLASGIGGAIAAIPGLNLIGTMGVGAVGSVVSDGLKGNINNWEDFGKSALKGGVANGIGYGVAKGMAALKVKQIGNMPRSSRKVYLRDNFYRNSQANANVNLKTFANSSMAVNIGIVETQVKVFRSGVYSTVTSTFATLF